MAEHDTRAGRLASALDDFIRSSPDVEAAAVVSFDGLTMASALPDDLEEDRLGAMSAALLSLGEQAALGLGRGQLNQVFVEGEHGFVFLMSARDQAVLAAIARRTAKIGFMLYEMRRSADRIGGILTPDVDLVEAGRQWAELGGVDDRAAGLADAPASAPAHAPATGPDAADRPETSWGAHPGQGEDDAAAPPPPPTWTPHELDDPAPGASAAGWPPSGDDPAPWSADDDRPAPGSWGSDVDGQPTVDDGDDDDAPMFPDRGTSATPGAAWTR